VQGIFVHIFQSKYVGINIYEWKWEVLAHEHGLDSMEFESRKRRYIILFPETLRPTLGPTESPIELVTLTYLTQKAARA
jgi:hypothetical protein